MPISQRLIETVQKKQKSLLKAPKVSGPYVVSLLNQMPIFEVYMARLIVKNGHPKDMRHHEIQLCAQNIDTIVGSVVNITIGGGGDCFKYQENLRFDRL